MPNINIPEFFTVASITSLGVSSMMVVMAANTLHTIFGVAQKYTAFVISLLIAYLYVAIKDMAEPLEWVLAFFNACLLFCTAMGMNNISDRTLPVARNFTATTHASRASFLERLRSSFSVQWL